MAHNVLRFLLIDLGHCVVRLSIAALFVVFVFGENGGFTFRFAAVVRFLAAPIAASQHFATPRDCPSRELLSQVALAFRR